MKRKILKVIKGNQERPRLIMYRSLRQISAQIIDDDAGKTLVSASTLEETLAKKLKSTRDMNAAKLIGTEIAKRALDKGIKKVVFDRKKMRFHGRVAGLADAARAAGLEF
ncbi:MAG: 50S ribosomal protein L18 [bacterium]